jgi:hypothetical protein
MPRRDRFLLWRNGDAAHVVRLLMDRSGSSLGVLACFRLRAARKRALAWFALVVLACDANDRKAHHELQQCSRGCHMRVLALGTSAQPWLVSCRLGERGDDSRHPEAVQ